MKTVEVRWFLIVLLFPAVALARPVDEGTEVRASGGGGRFFYDSFVGCASGPSYRYQADHVNMGASVHHRDDMLRGSVSVQRAEVEVTRGVTLALAPCDEGTPLAEQECGKNTPPPPDLGRRRQHTVVTSRIGFETPYLGLELGPALIVGDNMGTPLLLSMDSWFGLPEFHGTVEMMPYHNREPGFTTRIGFGHVSEALRVGIGVDLSIPLISGDVASTILFGKYTADAQLRVNDRLWLGAGLSASNVLEDELTDVSGQLTLTFEL